MNINIFEEKQIEALKRQIVTRQNNLVVSEQDKFKLCKHHSSRFEVAGTFYLRLQKLLLANEDLRDDWASLMMFIRMSSDITEGFLTDPPKFTSHDDKYIRIFIDEQNVEKEWLSSTLETAKTTYVAPTGLSTNELIKHLETEAKRLYDQFHEENGVNSRIPRYYIDKFEIPCRYYLRLYHVIKDDESLKEGWDSIISRAKNLWPNINIIKSEYYDVFNKDCFFAIEGNIVEEVKIKKEVK